MRAIDKINEQFITEAELANLLGVDPKRIRDLRSHHVKGKQRFIDHIKPTSKCVLYRYETVLEWLEKTDTCSFGKNTECDESQTKIENDQN